jgi:hypothetical protein
MEEFQAWDRHNPLPHIGPCATALNWVYGKTVPLSTDLGTELRKLQAPYRLEWQPPRHLRSLERAAELPRVCLPHKANGVDTYCRGGCAADGVQIPR